MIFSVGTVLKITSQMDGKIAVNQGAAFPGLQWRNVKGPYIIILEKILSYTDNRIPDTKYWVFDLGAQRKTMVWEEDLEDCTETLSVVD